MHVPKTCVSFDEPLTWKHYKDEDYMRLRELRVNWRMLYARTSRFCSDDNWVYKRGQGQQQQVHKRLNSMQARHMHKVCHVRLRQIKVELLCKTMEKHSISHYDIGKAFHNSSCLSPSCALMIQCIYMHEHACWGAKCLKHNSVQTTMVTVHVKLAGTSSNNVHMRRGWLHLERGGPSQDSGVGEREGGLQAARRKLENGAGWRADDECIKAVFASIHVSCELHAKYCVSKCKQFLSLSLYVTQAIALFEPWTGQRGRGSSSTGRSWATASTV